MCKNKTKTKTRCTDARPRPRLAESCLGLALGNTIRHHQRLQQHRYYRMMNRSSRGECGAELSSVPQGSVLGPLLTSSTTVCCGVLTCAKQATCVDHGRQSHEKMSYRFPQGGICWRGRRPGTWRPKSTQVCIKLAWRLGIVVSGSLSGKFNIGSFNLNTSFSISGRRDFFLFTFFWPGIGLSKLSSLY